MKLVYLHRFLLTVAMVLFWAAPAESDVFRPAYLEIREAKSNRYDVLWKLPALPDGRQPGADIRFPAGTRIIGKLLVIRERDARTERYQVEHPESLSGRTVVIEGLYGAATDVIVNIKWQNGVSEVFRVLPEGAAFELRPAQGRGAIAKSYLKFGVEHILTGFDHLLFVGALLLIISGWKTILATISAFTIAHSLTLAAATMGWIHLPSTLSEAIIALSIVFVAAEALRETPTLSRRMPWLVAFGFGLLHGIGFASALTEIGLTTTEVPLALLMFNVGVEVGQLLFVACILMFGALLNKLSEEFAGPFRTAAVYGVGAISAFWTIERMAAF